MPDPTVPVQESERVVVVVCLVLWAFMWVIVVSAFASSLLAGLVAAALTGLVGWILVPGLRKTATSKEARR